MTTPRRTRWLFPAWVVAAAAMAAIVLCLPALAVGWLMDDYAHRVTMLRVPGVPVEPLSVFANFTGDPDRNRQYMDQGILPWWTAPDYRLAFSRLLSAASMWIDYQLWPDSPLLMHVHSLLWLGAMVVVAGLSYRRWLSPGWVAGLAVVLFALDDAHAMAATWIANRNALIATTLGLLSLIAHHRWRRDGWRWGGIASGACLGLALLAGEIAVGHLVIAPLFTPVMAYAMKIYGAPMEVAAASLPATSDVTGQDVLVVSSPDYLTYICFLPPIQHAHGKPLPRRMIGLLAGEVGAQLSRTDPRTLRVEPRGGLFDGYLGRLFRDHRHPFEAGDAVALERMRVEVLAADQAGQPTELLFRFAVPLEDPSLRWITWEGHGYAPFALPAVGETIAVPPPPSATALSMPG
jgi:hypothetical protein